MTNTDKAYEHLLNLIDRAATRLYSMHNEAHSYGTGTMLHRAEIHTIQAIGYNPGINNAALARHMEVTKGAVSQIVTKLVKKGLVQKARLTTDSREVVLNLTDGGQTGFKHHEAIHGSMHGIIKEYFGDRYETSLQEHTKVMSELNDILDIAESIQK